MDVNVDDDGLVATKLGGDTELVTGSSPVGAGRHYFEVKTVGQAATSILVGVARPDLTTKVSWLNCAVAGWHCRKSGELGRFCNDLSHMDASRKWGDKLGVLLDMDAGSVLFFKNGVRHGQGYPNGSVEGQVVFVVQFQSSGQCCKLLPAATEPPKPHGNWPPTGHAAVDSTTDGQ